MNFSLPNSVLNDVGSTTSSFISGISSPVYIIIGILVASLIADILINSIRGRNNNGSGVIYVEPNEYE